MKLLWINVVILMFLGMVKTAPPPSSDSTVCNQKTEFDCELGTRRCIPQGWLCDGITDCDNWKDELDCPVSHICPEGSFQCKGQNKCIPSEYVCDGEVDCANHSDEESCLPEPTPSNTTSSAPTTPKTDEPDSSNHLTMFSCVFMVILKFLLV